MVRALIHYICPSYGFTPRSLSVVGLGMSMEYMRGVTRNAHANDDRLHLWHWGVIFFLIRSTKGHSPPPTTTRPKHQSTLIKWLSVNLFELNTLWTSYLYARLRPWITYKRNYDDQFGIKTQRNSYAQSIHQTRKHFFTAHLTYACQMTITQVQFQIHNVIFLQCYNIALFQFQT